MVEIECDEDAGVDTVSRSHLDTLDKSSGEKRTRLVL